MRKKDFSLRQWRKAIILVGRKGWYWGKTALARKQGDRVSDGRQGLEECVRAFYEKDL